jgi:hypothetical protein
VAIENLQNHFIFNFTFWQIFTMWLVGVNMYNSVLQEKWLCKRELVVPSKPATVEN